MDPQAEIFGSPGHMPPEQTEGKQLTPATDLFAVAVLLLELWSGKAPFRRKDPAEIEALLQGPRPKPSEIDPRLLPLDEVIERALSLDPLVRPQEADELGRALRRFLAGSDVHDVARALGNRVRELRAKPERPKVEKRPGLERPPSKPSAATIRTRTFAAREEVVKVWRASLPDDDPRTRQIPASDPPPKPPPAPETIATRPIETARRTPEARRSRAPWILAPLIVAAGAAIFFLGRTIGAERVTANPKVTPTSPASAASSEVIAATSTATKSSEPSVAVSVPTAPATTTTASTAPTPGLTGSSSGHAAEKAKLVLIGDPGTLVAVDGASRGSCPAQVSVEAGGHAVTFTFPSTGETLHYSARLKPGEKLNVRADFAAATPTVRAWR